MSTKRKSLSMALKEEAAPAKKPALKTVKTKESPEKNEGSRQDKRYIGGHFSPEVVKQLKLLGIEEDTTSQALIAEALNLLFTKYGKNPIA